MVAALKEATELRNALELGADPDDFHYHAFEDDEAWKTAWDDNEAKVYALEESLTALYP